MMCPTSIGIAGWSYADWQGIVYTEPKMDQLVYVSNFVDCIEINSTFYRPPFERTTHSWLERTSDHEGFFFTAKLHRDFTHQGKVDDEMVRQFHRGFTPLCQAGKLKHLLMQFRYDFASSSQTRRYLRTLVDCFRDTFRLVVEVRHRSWQSPESLGFLDELGVAVCNLDYPTSSQSFNLRLCTVGEDGYFRMHGRNAAAWFSKAGRDETYNYYYNEQELGQIKDRLDELGKAFESLTVIANNHYRGAELANALELKALVTGRRVPVPPGLIKTYPSLARIASRE